MSIRSWLTSLVSVGGGPATSGLPDYGNRQAENASGRTVMTGFRPKGPVPAPSGTRAYTYSAPISSLSSKYFGKLNFSASSLIKINIPLNQPSNHEFIRLPYELQPLTARVYSPPGGHGIE